jgi:hypothetical protein
MKGATQMLHPIKWRGRQWAVTEYGIEALDGSYAIKRDRLHERYWLAHMEEKFWVDAVDFAARVEGRARIPCAAP